MNNDQDKIIIKKTGLPGVNLAMMDFGMTSSVKITKVKVTRSIFKKHGKTYISTKERLEINDIIQTGKLKLKYRIVGEERLSDYFWSTYRIKRIDNNSTTSIDIDNSSVGDMAYILNRKSFEELFMEYPHTDISKIGSMKPNVKCKCDSVIAEDCKCKPKTK